MKFTIACVAVAAFAAPALAEGPDGYVRVEGQHQITPDRRT